ncbi:MAG TPA: hypothetical protein VMI56_13655 [Reyranella sp.]|nr:hypothetical protein [Reyranella sp.]
MNQPVKLHVPPIAANEDAVERHDRIVGRILVAVAIVVGLAVLFVAESQLAPEVRFGFFEATFPSP